MTHANNNLLNEVTAVGLACCVLQYQVCKCKESYLLQWHHNLLWSIIVGVSFALGSWVESGQQMLFVPKLSIVIMNAFMDIDSTVLWLDGRCCGSVAIGTVYHVHTLCIMYSTVYHKHTKILRTHKITYTHCILRTFIVYHVYTLYTVL